jgi:hypothetical protein
MRTTTTLLTATLIALGAATAPLAAHAGDRVQGSGSVQSETRSVGSFQAIEARGSMTIVLRQSGKEGVEVRADDNILPLIQTQVLDHGGVPTLRIDTKPNTSFSTRSDMRVTVDVATLSALLSSGSGDIQGDSLKTPSLKIDVRGSGDVQLKQLEADDLTLKVAGSGDVKLGGRAAKVALSIAGSGDVDTHSLQAEDVRISIAGSGDATVNARRTLAVSIAGSGEVTYSGDATVTSSIAGNGSVTKR